jgi:hypothetical protein
LGKIPAHHNILLAQYNNLRNFFSVLLLTQMRVLAPLSHNHEIRVGGIMPPTHPFFSLRKGEDGWEKGAETD